MEAPPSNLDSSDEGNVVPPAEMIGKMFHRFQCIRKLGQGAMATVLLGEDTALHRQVALKLLPRENKSNPGHHVWLEQFVREARAAAQLTHEGIVQVYEIGMHGGYLYIAMEAMLGGTLLSLVKKSGPLSVDRAVDYALQAADALSYAHQRGVLHRDIKPGNILLNEAGKCKLGDFGMAIIDDPKDTFELPRNFLGTPYYLAPEVLRHKSSPQSDVYALGATLWFLLTGRRPFDIKEIRDVLRVGKDLLLGDPREFCPRASPRLVALLQKALARDSQARFADAGEMFHALAEIQNPSAPAQAGVEQSAAAAGPASAMADLLAASKAPSAPAAKPPAPLAAPPKSAPAPKPAPSRGAADKHAPAARTAGPAPSVVRRASKSRKKMWILVSVVVVAAVALGLFAGQLVWNALMPPPKPSHSAGDAQQTDQGPPSTPPVAPEVTKEPTPTPPVAKTETPPPRVETPPAVTPPPEAAPVVLPVAKAKLNGKTMRLEYKGSIQDLGFWLNFDEWVSWTVTFPQAGTYEVSGEFGGLNAVQLKLKVDGKDQPPFTVPATGDWAKFHWVTAGKVDIAKAGEVTVEIHPASKPWKPVNMAYLKFQKVK